MGALEDAAAELDREQAEGRRWQGFLDRYLGGRGDARPEPLPRLTAVPDERAEVVAEFVRGLSSSKWQRFWIVTGPDGVDYLVQQGDFTFKTYLGPPMAATYKYGWLERRRLLAAQNARNAAIETEGKPVRRARCVISRRWDSAWEQDVDSVWVDVYVTRKGTFVHVTGPDVWERFAMAAVRTLRGLPPQ
jgi:hypothetical protein